MKTATRRRCIKVQLVWETPDTVDWIMDCVPMSSHMTTFVIRRLGKGERSTAGEVGERSWAFIPAGANFFGITCHSTIWNLGCSSPRGCRQEALTPAGHFRISVFELHLSAGVGIAKATRATADGLPSDHPVESSQSNSPETSLARLLVTFSCILTPASAPAPVSRNHVAN